MKEFIVKENKAFRLRVKQWQCLNPDNYHALEFVQEILDKDGELESTSTYQFFMTDEEIVKLCKGLMSQ